MISVLIVDDSATVRKVLAATLSKDPQIKVIGTAQDPYVARKMIVAERPDVMTLDIEMPRMDGITFLEKIMTHYPIPTIIVSSLTPKGSALALRAFELGAIDVLCKPDTAYSVDTLSDVLVRKVKIAATATVRQLEKRESSTLHLPKLPANQLLAIGASTGGTVAIERILKDFPEKLPATVITQHMPPSFTKSFADRLNSLCRIYVKEAENGDVLRPGLALIAPGGRHLLIKKSKSSYVAVVKDGPRVQRQKPSVDVMFKSITRSAGAAAVGVLLTGMGADGAEGLLEMKEAGATTAAQNEESCVVFGMPKVAIELNAVSEILPLDSISQWVIDTFKKRIE